MGLSKTCLATETFTFWMNQESGTSGAARYPSEDLTAEDHERRGDTILHAMIYKGHFLHIKGL